jgi:cbb3-type cytochrome oxidase maturation protein
MNVLVWLIPVSLVMGAAGLAAFWWTIRSRQYEVLEGDANRVLTDRWDEHPAP